MKIPMTCRTTWAVLAALAIALNMLNVNPVQAEEFTTEDVVREADAGNYARAYQVLEALAESGNAKAQGFLAYVLISDEWNIPSDFVRAKRLLLSALKADDPFAHFMIGTMNTPGMSREIFDGFPSPEDGLVSDDYLAHMHAAAEGGYPLAQFALGNYYRNLKEYNKSYFWYKKSAQSGLLLGKVRTAVIEDFEHWPSAKEPLRMIRLSTTGVAEIYEVLAAYYHKGYGVRRDPVTALTYLNIAQILGKQASPEDLEPYERDMTPVDIKRAQDQAESWLRDWSARPYTPLGEAAAWCYETGDISLQCIAGSATEHFSCSAIHVAFGFKNFTQFPDYKACRAE